MAENYLFKTETKKLLDMMINSIYTHKEIFLRELISNASDAIDKRHFLSLTNKKIKPLDYFIQIDSDKAERTLTITDNGIGFTHDELVDSLGTIAKSGSKEFLEKIGDKKGSQDIDIIGQFGVGFYSAFMVASKVEVITKSPLDTKGYKFVSEGLESYDIDEVKEAEEGSKIILHLRENTEDNNYDEYLDEYMIKNLIRKYSDYVRYPIKTWVTKYTDSSELDENGNPKQKEEVVLETINSMVPLWKKAKKDVKDEELNEFYKQKFIDWQDPLITIWSNVEGNLTYNALVFIPKKPPFDMYNEKYEKGLQLYTKGVFILDKCKELVPDYMPFLKGLVDSADLPLNISREILQEDKALNKIASNLEKKVLSELERILKKDREKYEEFFKEYGVNLKYGLYENYGARKDTLKDLILFESTNSDKKITLKEYLEKMPDDQKNIYYASAPNKEAVLALPQTDAIIKKGYDILVLTDHVDEFMLTVMKDYEGKEFKSVAASDLDLTSDSEKEELDKVKEESKDLLSFMKDSLPNVKEVKISTRLTDSACCLTSGEGLSFEMEKVLNAQQDTNGKIRAERILEVNPNHEIFKNIKEAYETDKDLVSDYAKLLYNEALLLEGMPLENAKEFSDLLNKLIAKK